MTHAKEDPRIFICWRHRCSRAFDTGVVSPLPWVSLNKQITVALIGSHLAPNSACGRTFSLLNVRNCRARQPFSRQVKVVAHQACRRAGAMFYAGHAPLSLCCAAISERIPARVVATQLHQLGRPALREPTGPPDGATERPLVLERNARMRHRKGAK